MAYQWAKGAVVGVEAGVAGTEIERILTEYGGQLRAEDVVEESRPEQAPLHKCFEWDDQLAADHYRRDQAQYIVRHLLVLQDDQTEYRAFVNVQPLGTDDTERIYINTAAAMADTEYRKQILQGALREIESVCKRYQQYAELATIVVAVEETRKVLV